MMHIEVPSAPVPDGWVVDRLDRWADVISTRMSYTEMEAFEPSPSAQARIVLGIKVSDMNLPGNETTLSHSVLTRPMEPAVVQQRCAPPGTIVFPKRGAAIATNKKRLTAEWTVFDPNVIGVHARDKIDRRFLFHWFQHFDLRGITEPGPTPQLNKKNLEPLIIAVPGDRDEQKAIAAVLDHVHTAIDVERRSGERAQDLKGAAMHELFSRGLRGDPQKTTEIGPIPASWDLNILNGYIEPPDYGFTASASKRPTGPKFLRITDIQDGQVDWHTVPYCECDAGALRAKRLHRHDIVVARIGATTGKAFLIEECPSDAVFASYLIRIRTRAEALSSAFLYYFMQSEAYWTHIDQHKGGRLKGGVNVPILTAMPIAVPPRDEQAEMVSILGAVDVKIDLHRRKLVVLEGLFRALLQKLITGTVRVSDLDLSALQVTATEKAT